MMKLDFKHFEEENIKTRSQEKESEILSKFKS